MAVSLAQATASVFSTSNVSAYSSAAFTPLVGDGFLVIANFTGTSLSASISGGGLNWYPFFAAPSSGLFMWTAQVRAAVSTTIVTTAFDAATGCVVHYFRIREYDVNSMIRQRCQNSGLAGATVCASYTMAPLTGNAYGGIFANSTNPAAMSAPASWTEAIDSGYATPTVGSSMIFLNQGLTNPTVIWGTSASTWVVHMFEVNAANTMPKNLPTMGYGI